MVRRVACSFLLLLILLSACIQAAPTAPTQSRPRVTTNPNSPPTLTPFGPAEDTPAIPAATQPADNTSASPASGPPALPQYILEATLDYGKHTLAVDEAINYPNLTGEELDSLVLAVEPNLWKNCFKLGDLMVSGQSVKGYHLYSDRLDLPLASPLAPNTAVNILLHYDLVLPPADVYHVFGFNWLQTNLVDWYPFVVPYSDGWVLHPPAEVGEHLVYDPADFEVTLHLADPRASMVIAAGAPAETANETWHYRLHHGRTFVFSASPYYQTIRATVGGIPVSGYYLMNEKDQATAAFQEVSKAVSTFSSLFGPYPYASLSMVESPYFDGMEYDGLFFLGRDYYISSDGTVLNNMIDIGVHETSHQWWFGSVGNDQALEPWLDEALATYSEELFYEKNYPDVTAWQTFRVDSFDPSGWVDTDVYHGVNFRTYANAVYLRGALFLGDLRKRIGEVVFFAFLKDYATQMAGKRSTSADFFRIMREHTSSDISDLLAEYFRHPPK